MMPWRDMGRGNCNGNQKTMYLTKLCTHVPTQNATTLKYCTIQFSQSVSIATTLRVGYKYSPHINNRRPLPITDGRGRGTGLSKYFTYSPKKRPSRFVSRLRPFSQPVSQAKV